ncbi:MAG: hypothetical protein HS111_19450 [Kofleriaceae bacterium]|nr:hypothetical protein [Kofleriaceae bacterium]
MITAARRVAAGEEACASATASSPTPTWSPTDGFAVDDNRDDVALLLFPPAPTPLVDVAAACLWDHRLRAPVELEVGARVEAGFRRALSLARLRAASYRDLLQATDRGRFDNRELLWLGPAVEAPRRPRPRRRRRPRPASPASAPAPPATSPIRGRGPRPASAPASAPSSRPSSSSRPAPPPYLADPSPHAWYRAAVSIDILASGGLGLVRHYILNIADELPR